MENERRRKLTTLSSLFLVIVIVVLVLVILVLILVIILHILDNGSIVLLRTQFIYKNETRKTRNEPEIQQQRT